MPECDTSRQTALHRTSQLSEGSGPFPGAEGDEWDPGNITPDYTALSALADDAQALIDEINLVLAANRLSAATMATMVGALQTMPVGTDARRLNRIHAALLLVLASPEFMVQK